MAQFCPYGHHGPSQLHLPPPVVFQQKLNHTELGNSTNSKYTFIGVREIKENSQQGKNLQVLKTTSLEIKLN